jgi:hypothetical protein
MIRKKFAGALMAIMAMGTIATAAAPLTGASAVHPAAVSHQAVLADTNGQPDPDPGTISPDIPLKMCQSSSPGLCAGDASGLIITGSRASAVPLKFNFNGNTYTVGGVTYNTGTLNMPSQSPACLGMNGIGNVTRQNCNTGTGIIWLAGLSNGHHVFGNRLAIQNRGGFQALASSGSGGQPFFVSGYPPANGVYERYDFG